MITFQEIRDNPVFTGLIERANAYLRARGYTEHGMRHVTYVANTTGMILQELGYSERMVELGRITGYLHDIGNMHNRKHHGISGANIVYTELRLLGMDLDEICTITTAIANHEEEIGEPVTPMAAALILADKSDAHRTRVNREGNGRPAIHDRVNLAILDSRLTVDQEQRTITFDIEFDQQACQIMDYFEIYLTRMEMCKQASTLLGCRFRLIINNLEFLGNLDLRQC